MRKLALVFICVSAISLAGVKVIDTKDESGRLTGGRSAIYESNGDIFRMDYEGEQCVAIRVQTDKKASKQYNEIDFQIDKGYTRGLYFDVGSNGKAIRCYSGGSNAGNFDAIAANLEKGKIVFFEYVTADDKPVARQMPLQELQQGIKELKERAFEPVDATTRKTRGKGADKQVWIEGTGWVYESLIEKK